MEYSKTLRLVTVLTILTYVSAHPWGAPYAACGVMYPKHGGAIAQKSPCPFEIKVASNNYSPDGVVAVQLVSPPGRTFIGFVIRANRISGDTEEIVGNFIKYPTNESHGTFWYPQEETYENCVTHNDNKPKSVIDLKWQAPEETVGDIQFSASFVENWRTFWVYVESEIVKANVQPVDVSFNSTISNSFEPAVFDGECGVTKGCLYFPDFCSGDSCNYIITYKVGQNDDITFEMKAKTVAYVSLAISDDLKMGEDETVTCMDYNGFVSVQHGYSPSYYNARHRISGFTNIQTQKVDGHIFCRFTMPMKNTLNHVDDRQRKVIPYTFDLNKEWYLAVAYGDLYYGADALGKHVEYPLFSDSKVNFKDNVIVRATSLPIETKIHASLMIGAWLFFANLAIVMASFMKTGLGEKMACGIKLWFQLHRLSVLFVTLFTIAAMILIFVKVGGWATHAQNHSICGCIVTGLLLIQGLMGLLRPSPTSSKRALFNWAHFTVGRCTQILAYATIILGVVQIPILHGQLKSWLVIGLSVGIGVELLIEVLLFIPLVRFENTKDTTSNMDSKIIPNSKHTFDVDPSNGKKESNSHGLKHATFAVYCFFIFVITCFPVICIFLF